ncbi:programmed cell death protein 2 [Neurospora tetraspora]|uniref:Programmed cell death protein 2 n=1 Tax=Neurospora tetraspora TaxID=94610 RepID=A0AAE0JHK1_9PEZI|nr:programmed cell death protein 2 [Neurospora tetraspora]
MAPYDDSSDEGEDLEFTETNVLLGYADADSNGEKISRLGGRPEWLDEESPASAALARCKVCKDYMVLLLQLNAELPDRFPGHERRLYVFSCRRKSCRRKEGSIRAVRGVRVAVDAPAAKEDKKKNTPAVEQEKKEMPKASTLGLGEALFGAKPAASGGGGGGGGGAKTNPFASGGGASSNSNPFAPKGSAAVNPFAPKQETPAVTETPKSETTTTITEQQKHQEQEQAEKDDLPKTFAQTLSLNNTTTQQTQTPPAPAAPSEPWPTDASALPPPYPERWIWDADYETLDPTPSLPPQKIETMDIDTETGSGSGGGGGKEDKDVFESTMDAVFQRFADRVGQNPEQVIRYEFAGQPLLYSKNDAVGKLLHVPAASTNEKVTTTTGKGKLPRCGNCGAGRVFEVQLTPHAIEELECEEDSMEGMDWGTIIVGVCEKDCSPRGTERGVAGYVEEWAGVQWEELSVKR